MIYRFKLFELVNDLSHQLYKDNLAFITIGFILLQYEVNLCDPSVKKKLYVTLLLWYGLGFFGCFFYPKCDVCQGFDLLSL